MRDRVLRAAVCAVGSLLLAGCVSSMLAPRIVTAPNAAGARTALNDSRPEARVAISQVYAQTVRVAVGPPTAELSFGVIEPGDYHHDYSLTIQRGATDQPPYFVHSRWDALSPDVPPVEPKGAILLLHGFRMSKDTVLHWAIHLAEAGYRTVAVDLRRHGSSTGPWVTFGAIESRDLVQVLDEIQRRGLAGNRVGVLGISYGASVGLQWAARDPRVGAIVALEPFSDPRIAIRQYARAMLSPTASQALSDRAIAAGTSKAARLAGFSWNDAAVDRSVGRLTVPVLFIHGSKDTILPPEHSRKLHQLAPAGSRLIETPEDDHTSLSMRLDGIAPEVVAWLDHADLSALPADSPCNR